MRSTIALLLAAGFVCSLLLPATWAQADDPQWTGIPADRRNAGLSRAENHGLFARFAHDADGNVMGRFVSFHFDNSTGSLSAFKISRGSANLTFFSSIDPSPFTAGAAPLL